MVKKRQTTHAKAPVPEWRADDVTSALARAQYHLEQAAEAIALAQKFRTDYPSVRHVFVGRVKP